MEQFAGVLKGDLGNVDPAQHTGDFLNATAIIQRLNSTQGDAILR